MTNDHTEILNYLTQTTFVQDRNSRVASFYNQLDENERQGVMISFVKDYESSYEAKKAEVLMDLYLGGCNKGTLKHQSKDAILRAFRKSRSNMPSIYTHRSQNKLVFLTQSYFPSGTKGMKTVEGTMDMVHEFLDTPLMSHDKKIVETIRDEATRRIESRIGQHRSKANSFFYQKFFPQISPFGDAVELELVSSMDYEQIKNAFDNHIKTSAPAIIYAGQDKSCQSLFEDFASLGDLNLDFDQISNPQYFELGDIGERIHVDGPSSQMVFVRAYPFKDKIEDIKERRAMFLFNKLLGGSWTAPLMQVIRGEHNLVYGFYSWYGQHENMLYLPTDHNPDNFDQIKQLTHEIVEDLVNNGSFEDDNFEREKENVLEGMICSNSRNLSTANQASFRISAQANRVVFGDTENSLVNNFHLLKSIDPDFVREVAKKYIDPQKSQILTYGGNANEN